jgi:hypothetical protein
MPDQLPSETCPACGGRLLNSGTLAPNPLNRTQSLKAHGLTCRRCGLNINSACVSFANARWPSWRRRDPARDESPDSVGAQTRTKIDQD